MLISFYNFLTYLFYIPYIILIYLRKFLKKEHSVKFKEKIFLNKFKRPKGFLFWFHVASIGELKSIYPIIDFYLKENHQNNFLITTVTLTSFEEFQKKYGTNKNVYHQFMPYDFVFLINSFFKNWKPDIATFVDSEIWPNFILKVKSLNIPLILLNARITKKSFNRWRMFGKSSDKIFKSFSSCISSSKDTSRYLDILGAQNIKFFGNIKFCSSINADNKDLDQFNKVKKRKIWCALSTHADEEIFCGKTHLLAKKTINDLLTIIIPRHINRIDDIYKKLKNLGLNIQIKKEEEDINNFADVVLVNYYGSVNKYLKSVRQVFIGKSTLKKFENSGGQNPIDAAKIGCHIFHGPYVNNFKDIYNFLDESLLSEKVLSPEDLASKLKVNFANDFEKNFEKISKIKNYSNKIFENVITEYKYYIR